MNVMLAFALFFAPALVGAVVLIAAAALRAVETVLRPDALRIALRAMLRRPQV